MEEVMTEFERWDGRGTLEFKLSSHGRDVLEKFIAKLLADDKNRYCIGWREKVRVMRRATEAVLFLTIEMCQPGQKAKYIPL
ncbi:hypothetical protein QKT49_gp392 [Acanthamoeba castellanii medusavirus]|uniref:Uncharacterized protein n=1 Tax=Acanthamoeba castellanii medusavirus J1 TaxID=3114988 RepID=A0A3T1CX22_9VIRU|nr:hypothetical protein QKT49_gp392 [Acanthamoeba castellanii medusavirus]BBI30371.1 hypothetical protein [Acanthamoeba castellanii medusavirus J1]